MKFAREKEKREATIGEICQGKGEKRGNDRRNLPANKRK